MNIYQKKVTKEIKMIASYYETTYKEAKTVYKYRDITLQMNTEINKQIIMEELKTKIKLLTR